ncbi:MAG TPA: radical SAM family heme chaperone HemW [Terriglobales bacterium]|nr:radical SAM family heme chaperone HemW [Terriglobales bacterium]
MVFRVRRGQRGGAGVDALALGLYLAVPFCRSKCSFCNFASSVQSPALLAEYAELLAREIALAAEADELGGAELDTIYWGGGTPTLLPPGAIAAVMAAVRGRFAIRPDAEHTMEAAPGTLRPETLGALAAAGVTRLSLGVQSFQDAEARSVGRLHDRATVLADLERARGAGFEELSLDLIAGLPHQTRATWQESVEMAIATGVAHVSVYMLEVDEDSRLGNELLAGGARYHAHTVPDEDLVADAYEWACERLEGAGLGQYEISNFARAGHESRHNERYWLRAPYLGVGLDAHSFLAAPRARRFANPDALSVYLGPLREGRLPRGEVQWLTAREEREEARFLGLRRREGIPWPEAEAEPVAGLIAQGLLQRSGGRIALTGKGRMVSNRVFAEFLE